MESVVRACSLLRPGNNIVVRNNWNRVRLVHVRDVVNYSPANLAGEQFPQPGKVHVLTEKSSNWWVYDTNDTVEVRV